MNYQGRDRVKTLVIYPNAAEAIIKRRADLGLPPVEVKDLSFGNDEIMELANTLDATLLSGRKATVHGFLDMLPQGWDIIWLITHGEEDGWYLSDGIVSVSETTTLVRASGAFLTVMNTCSSKKVAEEAAKELGTAFICTVKEVPDRQALITGIIFAQKLASGLDYVTAFEKAKPGQNSAYVLIEARNLMPPNERPESRDQRFTPRPGTMPSDEVLNRVVESVRELERAVNGSHSLGLPPLRDMTNTLKQDVTDLRAIVDRVLATVAEIKKTQEERNRLIWGLVIAVVGLLFAVSIQTFGG